VICVYRNIYISILHAQILLHPDEGLLKDMSAESSIKPELIVLGTLQAAVVEPMDSFRFGVNPFRRFRRRYKLQFGSPLRKESVGWPG